jgi:ribulose bisphosphate carboxylase small subunit
MAQKGLLDMTDADLRKGYRENVEHVEVWQRFTGKWATSGLHVRHNGEQALVRSVSKLSREATC